MKLWEIVARQFGKPTGFLGSVAGFIMSNRGSNFERNQWAVGLLNAKPTDTILEIGFGPGQAIKMISAIVNKGIVFGIDHSQKMLSLAGNRNREGIKSGRVNLICSNVSELSGVDVKFDHVLDVNSFQFWQNPVDDLIKIRSYLKPGGQIVLVQQPRKPGATDNDARKAGNEFSGLLQKAGFRNIEIVMKVMKPVSAIGVIGKNSESVSNIY